MLNRDIIQNNPERDWNWIGISWNSNITWDIIQNNPEKPWNWGGISCNSNITFNIIRENPEKPWNWREFSYNTFSKEKEEFIHQKFRKHFMGEGLGYGEYSLFRELMERVYHPRNLDKFENE